LSAWSLNSMKQFAFETSALNLSIYLT
jgi:hypothetical protein